MKYLIAVLISLFVFTTTPVVASQKLDSCSALQDAVKSVVVARNSDAAQSEALNVANQLPADLRAAMKELIRSVWSVPKNSLDAQLVGEKVFLSCYYG